MMEPCLNKADRLEQIEVSEPQTFPETQPSEEREHLQVYLRIRPFTSAERENGESQGCLTIEPPDTVLLKPPSLSLSVRLSTDRSLPQTGQRFRFSRVYSPETTQGELFEGTVKHFVRDVLEGGNSLVFTYGVTNAGKTYTFLGPDGEAGILPRSLNVIFGSIDGQVFTGIEIKPHRCREFTRLSREQQAEEATFKRNLFKQFKESEKSNSCLLNSTNRTFLEGSSMSGPGMTTAEDRICLDIETHTKFSIWVSFCEIYNENIHDLLEVLPPGALRRTALRLSQDVKGNAFVKDLRWVQVNSAEEAYKVMKLGKRNQSFSSTRLNQLSSRSHSIFSIRVLKIEDTGTPRVHTVSELCLCDLAGSERCAKTLNKGERLKEAGNINTSLLILGKCINALRHNQQQAKLIQHVPFRESKLTHYLQGFFCGRGKACMIVNINQCASMYDETTNVLKFSAVAQKVVVLSTRLLPFIPERSTSEASINISNTERKTAHSGRRSALVGWDSSLEDVQEDDNDVYEEETSLMEETMDETGNEDNKKIIISKEMHEAHVMLVKQLQLQLKKEREESLLLETRIREEIGREFTELFSEMQNDYNERLAREREILEERAERRLEIFKNLIDKMAEAAPSQDAQAMNISVDFCSSELADLNKANAPDKYLDLQGERTDDVKELDRKVIQLSELQDKVQEQQAHMSNADAGGSEDDKKKLFLQLLEKTSEVVQLEKQVADLQRVAAGSSSEREQLQETLAAFEKERKARQDTLADLAYQTMGKEEALASLEEERKAREDAFVTIRQLKRREEEMAASLEEERKDKEKNLAILEAERKAKEDAMAALTDAERSRDETLAALDEERKGKEDVQSVLEVERKEISRLLKESQKSQQEAEALQSQVRELMVRLEAKEHQLSCEKEGAEQALVELQSAQAQLDGHSKEIHKLTHKVEALTEELQKSAASCGDSSDQMKEDLSELKKHLADEKEKCESMHKQIVQLEHELEQAKEESLHKQLVFDQQLEQFTEKLNQQETASKQQVEELKKMLQQQEKMLQQPLDELGAKLERQEETSEEVQQLKAKLEEAAQASKKQTEELNEQKVKSQQQVKELKDKLTEQKETSDALVDDLKRKLTEQTETTELLRAQLEESKGSDDDSAAQELQKLNSDLQTEVASLRAKMSSIDETKESTHKTEEQLDSSEMERMLKEQNKQVEEKLAEVEKASGEREAELQKKLLEKEAMVTSLQRSLQEAQERREEEDSQALQETRRKEAERRRELLAVAHEAIAQKDAELEKKADEISRLKESAKQDAERVKSLSLDLQRKEDDSSDLKEKLADYKKQIQQIQKEISTMREEEKISRQKLADTEKLKKQLQMDLTNRDRTIQQLKVPDQMLQLYQKACKDLEAKERVMEDMRLALTEQEETQEQMEQVLEEKLGHIQELSREVEKLKGIILQQDRGHSSHHHTGDPSDDLKLAKEAAAQTLESLKLSTEKHQAERKKWQEEKLHLIGQAKEAEDKRNQEMRKFAEDRERYTRQQSQLDSLSSQLTEKEQTMETWRKERDTLVAALEVQLKKLLSSQAEKDKLIQQLRHNNSQLPQERADGNGGAAVAELQSALCEKEAEILRLKEELAALSAKTQTKSNESPASLLEQPQSETISRKSGGRRDARASASSRGSTGYPSVLDSSEISTENGKTSRFPQPELEISFSPLQPNRMALRRQGEESAVTVKITRSARKRKSAEMDKEEVEAQNRRNTRTKLTPKLTPHQEEIPSPAGRHDSQSSIRSRKEGTLQKIGDFLQSSPTLLGTKAKKMMSLVSGRADADSASSSSSLRLRTKKNKKKLYRPEISSPMDMPSHPIISREPDEKESDHQIIKRRLRSRINK